jgi:site-specific DNA recombinase
MQVTDGMSLGAQERELLRAALAAGYEKKETTLVREEGRSGKSIKGRPKLRCSLDLLESGEADAMFVTKIDRLARSTRDFLFIVDHSQKFNWRLILLDLNLDTSSYSSRFVVTIMSALAEMERAIIADRQRDVHRDRRAKGLKWGIDLGPKRMISTELYERIVELRALGMSYAKIASKFNAEGIKTPFEKRWHATTIKQHVDKGEKQIRPGEVDPQP